MRRFCIVALVALFGLLSACSPGRNQAPDVGAALTIGPNPPEVGPATVAVALSDSSGRPIERAKVAMVANLSDAGSAPIPAQAVEREPGRYEATIVFATAGDWFIVVRAELPDGRTLERTFEIGSVLWVTP